MMRNVIPIIARYTEAIEDKDLRSHKTRPAIIWSSISLFYLWGCLRLNISETVSGVMSVVTPWGLPILGFTEKHFLVLLFIMTFYFSAIFFFFIVKLHIDANPWPLFFNRSELNASLKVEEDIAKKPAESGQPGPTMENFRAFITEPEVLGPARNILLFWGNHPVFGFLEYFLAPIIFPALLCLLALLSLAIRVLC